MKLKIGADPELWIFDKKLGKIISAHGLFPGTKEEPYAVEHGAIQVDGMAAEYNILPAENADQFILYNLSVLRSLRDEISKRNPELDFDFVFSPVAEFGAEYINQQPDEARILGCSPDFNAWKDGEANPTPDAELPFRTASGHIHLGWDEDLDVGDPEHIEACCMMAKALDLPVAGRLLKIEGEAGQKRRELYGKAGAFRPKSYGMEYRTLSNCWLGNTDLMKQVYLQTQRSFTELLDGYTDYGDGIFDYAIEELINTPVERKTLSEFYTLGRVSKVNTVTTQSLDGLYAKVLERVAPQHVEGADVGRVAFDFNVVERGMAAGAIQPAVAHPEPWLQAAVANMQENNLPRHAAAINQVLGMPPVEIIMDDIDEEADFDPFDMMEVGR